MRMIYLIDDDKVFNFLNETLIRKVKGDSFHIKAFDNARSALNDIRECLAQDNANIPDKIFLDINMPEMDGWEFLDELNDIPLKGHRCDVIMLTSSVSPLDIAKSRTYSCVKEFVSKPISEEKLNEVLDSASK